MASVSFQVMSDLHLETHPSYDYKFKQTAHYLALLGDIGHVGDDRTFQFLEKQVKRYWAVFFLLGNHEPSNLSFDAAKVKVRAFESKMTILRAHSTIGRFVFLDQTRYDVSSTLTVLGCTLFSQVMEGQKAAVTSRLQDFRSISQWTVYDHNHAHRSDLDWLNQQVSEISQKEPDRRIVIFTHHSPSIDSRAVDPKHADSEVSSGFTTDLKSEKCWLSPAVKAWAFGHTHFNTLFRNDHGAKILSNQKGYYMLPTSDFQPQFVYSLGE
ncbi:hypothetical protein FQN54_002111 [Arachnomyces sp. PD_36]|nr:hypothetical protein FQN54_002111 [Arachnomyces sp. PD_36]